MSSIDHYAQLAEIVGSAVDRDGLDRAVRAVYAAHGLGQLTDDQAQGLAELVAARRAQPRQVGRALHQVVNVPELRRRARAGARARSVEHRQRQRSEAAGGWLPAHLAARFTPAQLAVLAVVLREIAANGFCALHVGTIAWRAGVCERTVRHARAEAERLGLLRCHVRGTSVNGLANVIYLGDQAGELVAWLARRRPLKGGKSVPPCSYQVVKKASEAGLGVASVPLRAAPGRVPRPG